MSKAERNRRYRERHAEECKERDHQRYMRQREDRLQHQREYYQEHRDEILSTKHVRGFARYGTIRRQDEREREQQHQTSCATAGVAKRGRRKATADDGTCAVPA